MKVDLDPMTRRGFKQKTKPPAIYEAGAKPIRLIVGGQDVEIKEQDGVLLIRSIEGGLVVRPNSSNVLLLAVEAWT